MSARICRTTGKVRFRTHATAMTPRYGASKL